MIECTPEGSAIATLCVLCGLVPKDLFPLYVVSALSSRLTGDSNACPPDLELGAVAKWLASRVRTWVSRQASLQTWTSRFGDFCANTYNECGHLYCPSSIYSLVSEQRWNSWTSFNKSCMIWVRSGRETSSEYEPCWLGEAFSQDLTGLYTFYRHFVVNLYKVGHPHAEA
jgi:hypothetical protein